MTDGRLVRLSTTPLSDGTEYILTAKYFGDRSETQTVSTLEARFRFVKVVIESFQDGVSPDSNYAGTYDAHISQIEPDHNFGDSRVLVIGSESSGTAKTYSILLAWDLSAVPRNAVIDAATITLNVSNPSSSGYGIYAMDTGWREDEVTWNELAMKTGAKPLTVGPSLTLRRAPLGTLGAFTTGLRKFWLNAEGVALIQAWVDGSRPNYGFVMPGDQGSDSFAVRSSQHPAIRQRPRLTLAYTLSK